MDEWMTSLNRKKHQRRLNRFIREINQNIERDDLWDGRFYVHQVRASFQTYYDKSGGDLWVELEFVDRKTGTTMPKFETGNAICMWRGSKLWQWMNYFITEWCDVWKETPGPYEAKKLREEANNDSSKKRCI